MLNNKKGLALVAVLIFAICIFLVFVALSTSNTNMLYENKQALRATQAYYLSQSAIQKVKLFLKYYPNDFYKWKNKGGKLTDYCKFFQSSCPDLQTNKEYKASVNSTFNIVNNTGSSNSNNLSPDSFPFGADWGISEIELKTDGNDKGSSATRMYLVKTYCTLIDGTREKDKFKAKEEAENFTLTQYSGDYYAHE